jgi:hypothetical protein
MFSKMHSLDLQTLGLAAAAPPAAKERELLSRIIVIAVHSRLILLDLDFSD